MIGGMEKAEIEVYEIKMDEGRAEMRGKTQLSD